MSILIYALLALVILLALSNLWTRNLARNAEIAVPRTGTRVQVNGATMHYVQSGRDAAQTLVMIHGLAAQLQHFTYALEAQLASDFRLIMVDRPGCGYSTVDQGDAASLADQARMIWEMLDTLGVGQVTLVGHSLGGAVSLAMAMERPEQTAALALICPLTAEQTEAPDVFKGLTIRTPWLRSLLGHTIAVPLAKLGGDKMLTEAFAPDTCPDDFMDRAGANLGLRPQGFITASRDLAASAAEMPGFVARYGAELKAPGGILYGGDDNVLSPALHGAPMQAHGLSYEEIAGRGHMLPFSAVAETADFIRRMAAKAAGAAPARQPKS